MVAAGAVAISAVVGTVLGLVAGFSSKRVNQVIMLSLSMSVIASMVGAPGLGKDIIQALSRTAIALGFEAGLAVVIIAMILDRITGGFGIRSRTARSSTAGRDSRRAAAASTASV